MRMRFVQQTFAAGLVVALAAGPSLASVGPFAIPVDELSSTVTVEICIPGGCGSDISAVSGFYVVGLDNGITPSTIELHDFDLSLTDTININISVFLGSLDVVGENLRFFYAQPGVPLGPAPIEADSFLFVGAPTNAEGLVTYNAMGTVCAALSSSGLPCADTRDLAQLGTQSSDLAGTIVVVDGVATLTADLNFLVPLDPNNPALGTLSVVGTITGSASVPEPAPIPAVSAWGVAVMTLLAAAMGTIAFRARFLMINHGRSTMPDAA